MALKALVIEVGARLGRSASDVEPFLQALADNWYDNVDSVRDATADDLTSVGLPRRFAVELAAAAPGFRGGGQGRDRKGKSKGRGKDEDKGGRKGGKSRGRGGEIVHTVPIDLKGVDPEFLFKPKILGKRGSHVHHIQDQTGATIELQGNDSDGYMELAITGQDSDATDSAVGMCEDLVGTIFSEYDDFATAGGKRAVKGDRDGKGKKGKGKGKEGKVKEGQGKEGKGKEGKGKGKGKERGGKRTPEEGEIEERVSVDSEGVDPEVLSRRNLVGERGCNVKHIEQETGCSVQVEGDASEGMAFVIHSKDEAAIAMAKNMCEDLLANILEDAGTTAPAAKRSRGGRGRKGSKGKGKGKREGDDAEERPRKAARTE